MTAIVSPTEQGVMGAPSIAATPAVVNAVVDTLAHSGVTRLEMPVAPERVWRAIGASVGSREGGAA